jgi:predicted RNase H-like nuclease (RuvC/YqgF family)
MFDSSLKNENEELKAKVAKLEKELKSTCEVIDYQREERYRQIDQHEVTVLLHKRLEELAAEIEKILDDYCQRTMDEPEVEAYCKHGKYVVLVKMPIESHGTRYMHRDNRHGWGL